MSCDAHDGCVYVCYLLYIVEASMSPNLRKRVLACGKGGYASYR